jgi:AAHS family 4-hydroxybenzoate transporter-like MFS transporter
MAREGNMDEVIIVGAGIGGLTLGLYCAAVLLLDGFDTTAIGFAAPSLAKEWRLTKAALGPVFSAGLFA